jgi:hypothetical protein
MGIEHGLGLFSVLGFGIRLAAMNCFIISKSPWFFSFSLQRVFYLGKVWCTYHLVLRFRPLQKARKCGTAALGCSWRRAGEGACSTFSYEIIKT